MGVPTCPCAADWGLMLSGLMLACPSARHAAPPAAPSPQVMMSKCDKVLEGLQAFPQRSF